MSYTTSARLIWKQGIPFGRLAKRMTDFFATTGLGFHPWDEWGGSGIFRIETYLGKFGLSYSSAPWQDDPMLRPDFFSAQWVVCEPDGSWWGEFGVCKESNPGTSVQTLHLALEGWFFAVMDDRKFSHAVRKYRQLKGLFAAVDCDELVGVNQESVDAPDKTWHPNHHDKDFRFAKSGTQILIRQMEEGRPLRNLDYESGRIFIEPPGASRPAT